MRRTLLSVVVAVVAFAVTSAALVYGFELVAGRSAGPVQGSSVSAPERAEAADSVIEPSGDPDPATPSDISAGPLGGVGGFGLGVGPSSDAQEPAAPVAQEASEPKTGVLSQDFRKLGIDDPTTVIDESLRSACDVVGGTIAGPALCNDR